MILKRERMDMKIIMRLIVVCFILIISITGYAEPVTEPDPIVQQLVTAMAKEYHVPGVAVVLYVNGQPSSYYFGYANRDKKIPVTKNTIFEIGSISKVMMSLLLAQEVDDATVQFDDSITKYLPDLPSAYTEMSLQSLATHTSRLPFYTGQPIATSEDLEKYLQRWKPKYAVDDEWNYSNLDTEVLRTTLETITHKDISELYRDKILLPLGMQPIAQIIPKRLQKNVAQGYDPAGDPAYVLISPSASGSMKASANDMQHFLRAAIGLPGTPESILYPMRMTQAAYVELPHQDQGLGWEIYSLQNHINNLLDVPDVMNLGPIPVSDVYDIPKYNGNTLIDKTGATGGFRSYIALIPSRKTGIVILTNKSISDKAIVKTGREILLKLAKVSA